MRTNTGQNNHGDEGPRIRNRADLIEALTIAAQLEHGLMLMYLYAAFSMKAFPEELQGYKEPPEILRARLRDWESSILRVARQEMEHLSFVCNMLIGIGGAQYFDRANFPQDHRYWPVELPIELERFGVRSLLRFLAYEKPQNLCDPEVERLIRPHRKDPGDQQPFETRFGSIGELYQHIMSAFGTIPEKDLFLVPPDNQVDNELLFQSGTSGSPVYDMTMFKVGDVDSARRAIREIIEEGEGTLHEGPVTLEDLEPGCHYRLFRRILEEYLGGLGPREPLFEGARNCVRNPAIELHQDTVTRPVFHGHGTQGAMSVALITDEWTREMMGISNTAYEVLLQMLIRLYTAADDTTEERSGIVQTVFFPMMTMVIRPISELMSLLPAFKGFEGGFTAGAGFEFFRTVGFLPHKPAAWITMYERLSENAQRFNEVTSRIPPRTLAMLREQGYRPDTQLPFIRDNLRRIASNFKAYMNI